MASDADDEQDFDVNTIDKELRDRLTNDDWDRTDLVESVSEDMSTPPVIVGLALDRLLRWGWAYQANGEVRR